MALFFSFFINFFFSLLHDITYLIHNVLPKLKEFCLEWTWGTWGVKWGRKA
jgi:hypothetical protein